MSLHHVEYEFILIFSTLSLPPLLLPMTFLCNNEKLGFPQPPSTYFINQFKYVCDA